MRILQCELLAFPRASFLREAFRGLVPLILLAVVVDDLFESDLFRTVPAEFACGVLPFFPKYPFFARLSSTSLRNVAALRFEIPYNRAVSSGVGYGVVMRTGRRIVLPQFYAGVADPAL